MPISLRLACAFWSMAFISSFILSILACLSSCSSLNLTILSSSCSVSSFPFNTTAPIATANAPSAVTTNPIGLAAITALKAPIAVVDVLIAVVIVVIIDIVFNAATVSPTATASDSKLSIQNPSSFTAPGRASSISQSRRGSSFLRPFSIVGPNLST